MEQLRQQLELAERTLPVAKRELQIAQDLINQAGGSEQQAAEYQKRRQWKAAMESYDLALDGYKKVRHALASIAIHKTNLAKDLRDLAVQAEKHLEQIEQTQNQVIAARQTCQEKLQHGEKNLQEAGTAAQSWIQASKARRLAEQVEDDAPELREAVGKIIVQAKLKERLRITAIALILFFISMAVIVIWMLPSS